MPTMSTCTWPVLRERERERARERESKSLKSKRKVSARLSRSSRASCALLMLFSCKSRACLVPTFAPQASLFSSSPLFGFSRCFLEPTNGLVDFLHCTLVTDFHSEKATVHVILYLMLMRRLRVCAVLSRPCRGLGSQSPPQAPGLGCSGRPLATDPLQLRNLELGLRPRVGGLLSSPFPEDNSTAICKNVKKNVKMQKK